MTDDDKAHGLPPPRWHVQTSDEEMLSCTMAAFHPRWGVCIQLNAHHQASLRQKIAMLDLLALEDDQLKKPVQRESPASKQGSSKHSSGVAVLVQVHPASHTEGRGERKEAAGVDAGDTGTSVAGAGPDTDLSDDRAGSPDADFDPAGGTASAPTAPSLQEAGVQPMPRLPGVDGKDDEAAAATTDQGQPRGSGAGGGASAGEGKGVGVGASSGAGAGVEGGAIRDEGVGDAGGGGGGVEDVASRLQWARHLQQAKRESGCSKFSQLMQVYIDRSLRPVAPCLRKLNTSDALTSHPSNLKYWQLRGTMLWFPTQFLRCGSLRPVTTWRLYAYYKVLHLRKRDRDRFEPCDDPWYSPTGQDRLAAKVLYAVRLSTTVLGLLSLVADSIAMSLQTVTGSPAAETMLVLLLSLVAVAGVGLLIAARCMKRSPASILDEYWPKLSLLAFDLNLIPFFTRSMALLSCTFPSDGGTPYLGNVLRAKWACLHDLTDLNCYTLSSCVLAVACGCGMWCHA